MKNLIIMRHAKSSWENFSSDFERTLEHRGVEDAFLVASEASKWLPSNFSIFSSPAKRARETALIFAKTITFPVENINFIDELYTFDENDLESQIKLFDDSLMNCYLFGHNEAITNFVNKFGTIFIDNVPTAGLVWLQFETESWKNIKKGTTKKTIFPKNLK